MDFNDEQVDEIIEDIQGELNPPTLQEFELGMTLSCIMDAIVNPGGWTEGQLNNMLNKADDVLDIWLDKYETMMLSYNNLDEE